MGLVFPLVLNSPYQVYPRGKVLEVFWGVFEGYTRGRASGPGSWIIDSWVKNGTRLVPGSGRRFLDGNV